MESGSYQKGTLIKREGVRTPWTPPVSARGIPVQVSAWRTASEMIYNVQWRCEEGQLLPLNFSLSENFLTYLTHSLTHSFEIYQCDNN